MLKLIQNLVTQKGLIGQKESVTGIECRLYQLRFLIYLVLFVNNYDVAKIMYLLFITYSIFCLHERVQLLVHLEHFLLQCQHGTMPFLG